MLEPRGHDGMYGAILVQETELTKSGEADIGVLFCHNGEQATPPLAHNLTSPLHRGIFYNVWSCNNRARPLSG